MQALGQESRPKLEPCAEDAADKNGADTNGAGRGAAEGSAWRPPSGSRAGRAGRVHQEPSNRESPHWIDFSE